MKKWRVSGEIVAQGPLRVDIDIIVPQFTDRVTNTLRADILASEGETVAGSHDGHFVHIYDR